MKFSFATALVVTLAAESAVASSWFSKAVYNKWHETELERWLSDHDVPYPTPADRKDLENLVKSNWQNAVESPYANWDSARLQKYLNDRGQQVKKGTEKNKDQLVVQAKSRWHEAEGVATDAYTNVRDWIFDTWTESSLKAFCDYHGIPVPQPRTRDTLLKTAREGYQNAANKAGETAAYPGNWLYSQWSDSELKAWLDEHGVPAPQPSSRDKLVASVRRNSYVARKQAQGYAQTASSSAQGALSDASKSAQAAQKSLSDAVFDAWSDSEIKAWADKNGIKVPQGSNRNELLAIARKNVAKLTGDNIPAQAASAYGAATSSAGNEFAKATHQASAQGNYLVAQASKVFVSIFDQVQIAVGLKTNYLSSASKSASSAGYQASKSGSSIANQASKSGSSAANQASKSASSLASKASAKAEL